MEEREEVCKKDEPAVILTQDGMITAVQGKYYFERLKSDAWNKVIITGHAAKGTIGSEIFSEKYCVENSVNLEKDHIIFKVHLDDEDAVLFNKYLEAKTIVLFHAVKERTTNVISKLAETGAKAMCLTLGEGYEI